MAERIPEIVFDGECGICREWVDYWHALTGDRVTYRPYQEAAADYPSVDIAEFREAVQYIDAEGTRYSGAAATFELYRGIGGWFVLAWLYRHVPLFATSSEFSYRFFAHRRRLLAALTHFARGRNFRPSQFKLTAWLILRAVGITYFCAMASFAVQAKLLIGSDGILPLVRYVPALRDNLGSGYWHQVPMLFWFNQSDVLIQWLPIAGCVLAVAVVLNFFTRTALIALFVIYLSLYYAGQTFMTFQWDAELLEVGMLAILLTTGSRVVIWLGRWFMFRFMFLAGVVKIMSGDPTWRNLTALNYHFETQPLPSPLAWYAAQLPEWILKTGVAGTLFIELVLPFLIFAPRRLRMFAACGFILLQCLIMLTGNYNFFNLLSAFMCLFLFDDAALGRLVPSPIRHRIESSVRAPRRAGTAVAWVAALIIFYSSSELLVSVFSRGQHEFTWLTRTIAPCQCVNNYGPFAVMTTKRHEIVIEGSDDGTTWKEYDFNDKPGDVRRRPAWIIPHQPRVDWQMWFAALGSPRDNPWFTNLLVRILQGDKTMAQLFRVNPFPHAPPRWVRARYYLYRFTSPAEHAKTGAWWKRKLLGTYFPPIGLRRESQ